MPPGLGQLDAALLAFAEFFDIDQDLIAAAAEASPSPTATEEPLERWLTLLPEVERNAFLLRVANGEAHVGIELRRRLREIGGTSATQVPTAALRSFAELQEATKHQEQLRAQREREATERARLAKLADTAKREEQIWTSIPDMLAKRTASGYDEGVALLVELRDLAVHRKQRAAFDARLAEVTAPYTASPAFQRRLKEKRLVY